MPPELSSLNELDQNFFADRWLLESGVLTDSSSNTLIAYALSQKGVRNAKFEFDQDLKNNGQNPSVKYFITLEPLVYLKWEALRKAEKIKSRILRKLCLLILVRFGAPISIESTLIRVAKDYLPPRFNVEVVVNEAKRNQNQRINKG